VQGALARTSDSQVNPKFTCFTSTEVQILTLTRAQFGLEGTQFTCFPGTKVQLLTQLARSCLPTEARACARWVSAPGPCTLIAQLPTTAGTV
jgi:hypothetical protein